MASARDMAVKRGETVHYFRPDQFVIRPELNARDLSTPDNVEHVEWLATEMKSKGFISLLRCMMYEGELVLTEGHCRLKAAQLAVERGWLPADTLLPALTEPKGTSLLDLYGRQMSGNGTSKALNAEEALANVKRIMSIGKTAAETAALIGKSPSWVGQLLNFQSAPTEVHKMVADGVVSLSVASRTIRKAGNGEGAKVLKLAVAKAAKQGRKRATAADVRGGKRLGDDTIETMITLLRRVASRGEVTQGTLKEIDALLGRIDKLRGGE